MLTITSRRFAGEAVHGAAGVLVFGADGGLLSEATPDVVAWCRRCKDIVVEEEAETTPDPKTVPADFDVETAKRPELLAAAKLLDLGLHATATNEDLRAAISGYLAATADESEGDLGEG